MKQIKIFVATACAALCCATAAAQRIEAPADSVSAAMATVIAGYARPSLESTFPEDALAQQLFLDGIKKVFESKDADRSYYMGVSEGLRMADHLKSLRQQGYPIDNAAYLDAFIKAMNGGDTGFNPQTAEQYLNDYQQRIADARAGAEREWLERQAAREGVVKTPSGLLFEVLVEGEGESPKYNDDVEVFYTGRLSDGTVFDGTKEHPATFAVNRLIKGFTEGLQLMKPGGVYRLMIPSELGYGERGAGDAIPGGAALDFEVTLVGVLPQK